jgi:hypothetical protein
MGHHGHYNGHPKGRFPIVMGAVPVFVSNPSPPMPAITVIPVVFQNPSGIVDDPAKRPAKPSTPAGRLKSREYEARGDDKLRKQLWAQAYLSYRSAVDVAGDQGEAHFRLGFVYTAMQYYPSAIREFKRGLFLSPELTASGIRMSMLFGPDSEIVRMSILNKVADWVREDSRDPDRLFLLGLLLHFEDDSRRREVLQAARQMAGGNDDHITALLAEPDPPIPAGAKKVLLETLPTLPDPANPVPLFQNAPPLANAPHAGLPQVGPPQPPPPIGLPPLNTKPTPPVGPAPGGGKP